MSSLPEKIEVTCPKCGESYADWYRPSHDPATSSNCPHCGFDLKVDRTVRQDGGWDTGADEPEALEG